MMEPAAGIGYSVAGLDVCGSDCETMKGGDQKMDRPGAGGWCMGVALGGVGKACAKGDLIGGGCGKWSSECGFEINITGGVFGLEGNIAISYVGVGGKKEGKGNDFNKDGGRDGIDEGASGCGVGGLIFKNGKLAVIKWVYEHSWLNLGKKVNTISVAEL